jgi:hypothetical protein
MEQAEIREIKSGYLAVGNGWAVQGATREEALGHFHEAVESRRQIDARVLPERTLTVAASPNGTQRPS